MIFQGIKKITLCASFAILFSANLSWANDVPVVTCDNQDMSCYFQNLQVLDRRAPDSVNYAEFYCTVLPNTEYVLMRNHCILMKGFSYITSGMSGYILFHPAFTDDPNNHVDAFHPLSTLNQVYFQGVMDDIKYGETCDNSRIEFIVEPQGALQCFSGSPPPEENRHPIAGIFG